MELKSDFIAAGRYAAMCGRRADDCLYPKRTNARAWWMEGYNQMAHELHETVQDIRRREVRRTR
jgi:hypothetical protein